MEQSSRAPHLTKDRQKTLFLGDRYFNCGNCYGYSNMSRKVQLVSTVLFVKSLAPHSVVYTMIGPLFRECNPGNYDCPGPLPLNYGIFQSFRPYTTSGQK